MGEELSINNMMSDVDIDNLFSGYDEDSDTNKENPQEDNSSKEEATKEKQEDTTTESVNPDDIFDEDDHSESVGSGKDNKEKENPPSDEDGTSPNPNFYSSIAKAFEEDGVFPDLTSDDINEIKDAETLRAAIDRQIQSQLDEKQKRIDEALGVGIEPNQIRQYENTLRYIDSITDEQLNSENEAGENLRKNLIYQDFINRGYSKERAEKEVKKSIDAGTDIDDAKDALEGNKEFFSSQYKKLVDEARAESDKLKEERAKQAETLKKSILEDTKIFGDLQVDKNTRKKVYENISKPVYKDKDGEYYTAIQKYEMENRTDFLKNVGLIFTLTDGFKNLDGLIKGKVQKEVKSSLRNLEKVINNTSRNSDGNLNFAGGSKDEESFFRGYSLDL